MLFGIKLADKNTFLKYGLGWEGLVKPTTFRGMKIYKKYFETGKLALSIEGDMKFLEEYKFPKDTYYLSLSSGDSSMVVPKLPEGIWVMELLIGEYPISFPFPFPSNLKELKINAAGPTQYINTLPDISYLKKLWYLDIERFGFASLPNNLPDSLRVIMANRNKIKKIPKKLPKNLVYINLNNNLLTSLPELAYLKKLSVFFAHYNKIKKIFKVYPGEKVRVGIQGNGFNYLKLSKKLFPYFKKRLLF